MYACDPGHCFHSPCGVPLTAAILFLLFNKNPIKDIMPLANYMFPHSIGIALS